MIDVHHHMFPPALLATLAEAGVDGAGGEPLPTGWSPGWSLELMDRYGIGADPLGSVAPPPR